MAGFVTAAPLSSLGGVPMIPTTRMAVFRILICPFATRRGFTPTIGFRTPASTTSSGSLCTTLKAAVTLISVPTNAMSVLIARTV